MEINAVTSMKTWKCRCIQGSLSKQDLLQSTITITVYIQPTHIKQEVPEWTLSDSRWMHLVGAIRKWTEFSSPHLFSLVLLALLLLYYYTLLHVQANIFHAYFLMGGQRMGSVPILCGVATRRNAGSWCIWLLEMFRSSTSCWIQGETHAGKCMCW